MEIYKPKFTGLQESILRYLFVKAGRTFTARALSLGLHVSQTAIAKALKGLVKEYLILVEKDKETKRLSIHLNRDNPLVFNLKRVDNLKLIYETGLAKFLYDSLPGTTIILFGSYSYGEDTWITDETRSDIDIAVIGSKERDLNLYDFEKILERQIIINFYADFTSIHKNLRANLFNGIVIKGSVHL